MAGHVHAAAVLELKMARNDAVGHGEIRIQDMHATAQGRIGNVRCDDDVVGDVATDQRRRALEGEQSGAVNRGIAVDGNVLQNGAGVIYHDAAAAAQIGVVAHRVTGHLEIAQGGGMTVQQDAPSVAGGVGNSREEDPATAFDPEAVDLGVRTDVTLEAQGGAGQVAGDGRQGGFQIAGRIIGAVPAEELDSPVVKDERAVQQGQGFNFDRVPCAGAIDGVEQGGVFCRILLHVVSESLLEIDPAGAQEADVGGILGVDVIAGRKQGRRHGLPGPGGVGRPDQGGGAACCGRGEAGALHRRIGVGARGCHVGRSVHVHTGGRQLDPGAVVGENGLVVSGIGGGHRQHTRSGGQIGGHADIRIVIYVVVAGGCDDQAAGVLGSGHGGAQNRRGTPAAVDDLGAIGGGVDHAASGEIHPHQAPGFAVGRPAAAHGHDLAARRGAGDAEPVVGDPCSHSGAVRAMAAIVHGIVVLAGDVLVGPALAGVEVHEIPAPDVVDLAVAVVIETGRAEVFGPVGPDRSGHLVGMVSAKVGMMPINTCIENADDDVGITQGFIPGAHGADVGAAKGHVAQVPLRAVDARIVGQIGLVHLADVDQLDFFHLGQGFVG